MAFRFGRFGALTTRVRRFSMIKNIKARRYAPFLHKQQKQK
jgi:hypothetical protein